MNATLDPCPHRPPCPGCPRYAEPGIARSALHALNELARMHGVDDVPLVSEDGGGFRLRARLAIRGRVGSPKLGLFELDSHRVVHTPNCRVHHPLINHVAAVVRRALVETKSTCYSDQAHLGLARYLQVAVERSSRSAQVVLVANSPDAGPAAACLDAIRDRLGSQLHSLWFNSNCTTTNTILGPDFVHWHGPSSIVERFGEAAVHYPPGAFGQSNLEIAQKIIDHVRALIPVEAEVMEYYSGVGAIGLSLLSRVKRITMNEVSPHSLEGLKLGLADLDAADSAKVVVAPGEAAVVATRAQPVQVVIADPPRKGLDAPLIEHLLAHPPERFIYISCGIDSLCRDAARLTSGGHVRLAGLVAFNLMPYTEHVETVACFESTSRFGDSRNH